MPDNLRISSIAGVNSGNILRFREILRWREYSPVAKRNEKLEVCTFSLFNLKSRRVVSPNP